MRHSFPDKVCGANLYIIRPADAYHTLYNLSGLSAAQHRVYYSRKRAAEIASKWKDTTGFIPEHVTAIPTPARAVAGNGGVIKETETEREIRRKSVFVAAHAWQEDDGAGKFVGGKGNRVVSTNL